MDLQDLLRGAHRYQYLEYRHGGIRYGAERGQPERRRHHLRRGIDISGVVGNLETTLADWSIGSLLGLWFQSIFVGLCSHILTIAIFLVIYGRMIEVYLTVSVGPIPFATMANREWGQTGQNYLKSLLALGFQAFLIMVCVGIYAVLVQNIAVGDDITVAIWECLGYTVLLCYTLFRTGSLAKSLFGAH